VDGLIEDELIVPPGTLALFADVVASIPGLLISGGRFCSQGAFDAA
jgi:hypothetical protein